MCAFPRAEIALDNISNAWDASRKRLTSNFAELCSVATAPSIRRAAKVLEKYDADRSGRIELDEFATLVAELRAFQERASSPAKTVHASSPAKTIHASSPARSTHTSSSADEQVPAYVSSLFRRFDADRSGELDAGELRAALVELGLPVDSSDAAAVLRKCDADGGAGAP